MAAEHVAEASQETFRELVIERSRQLPVLVDFWAPWCGPCRMLGPVLEKLAGEMADRFALVKVNTDDNQQVAAQYGIRGIPDVKLFVDGEVVDGFVGALPEAQVRAFLAPHCPSEADEAIATARTLLAAGRVDDARASIDAALAIDPRLAAAQLLRAQIALGEGDLDQVAVHVGAIASGADEHEAGQRLLEAVQLARAAAAVGDRAAVQARVDADPGDVEALYALAGHEVAAGNYDAALASYLASIRIDRKWRDQAARKAMLVVFGILGARHPTSDAYRDQLMLIY